MKSTKVIWKRVALLLGGVLALCGLASLAIYAFQNPLRSALNAIYWKSDPAQAAEAARALVDFDLPPGYQPEKLMRLKGETALAVILASQAHPGDLIIISQTPDGILANEAWRTKYEVRGAHQIAGQLYDTETVDTTTATVRGQPTTLRLLEGLDQNGQAVRQLACMFNGKSGEILLVMVASQSSWDQAMVDRFLSSIR
jgi:hypothetical protein